MTGRNTDIEFNFLIAGHTKFSCDLCFGYLKKKTRRTDLNCLQDIQDVTINTTLVLSWYLHVHHASTKIYFNVMLIAANWCR